MKIFQQKKLLKFYEIVQRLRRIKNTPKLHKNAQVNKKK